MICSCYYFQKALRKIAEEWRLIQRGRLTDCLTCSTSQQHLYYRYRYGVRSHVSPIKYLILDWYEIDRRGLLGQTWKERKKNQSVESIKQLRGNYILCFPTISFWVVVHVAPVSAHRVHRATLFDFQSRSVGAGRVRWEEFRVKCRVICLSLL